MIPEQVIKIFCLMGALISIFNEKEFYQALDTVDEEDTKKEVQLGIVSFRNKILSQIASMYILQQNLIGNKKSYKEILKVVQKLSDQVKGNDAVVKQKDNMIRQMQLEMEDLQVQMEDKNNVLETFQQQNNDLNEKISKQDEKIVNLKEQIYTQQDKIKE